MAKKKEEVQNTWTQSDVDLMLWNYSVGIVEIASRLGSKFIELNTVNELIKNRTEMISTMFKQDPSFDVNVTRTGKGLEIKKTMRHA